MPTHIIGIQVSTFFFSSTVQAAAGNDRLDSPWNVFSPKCLELVLNMSTAAKDAGYLVPAGDLLERTFSLSFLAVLFCDRSLIPNQHKNQPINPHGSFNH